MHKSIKALLLFSVVFTVCVAALGLRRQDPVGRPGGRQVAADESQFPIAEEAEPDFLTPAERGKRADKEKKYRGYKDTIGPGVTTGGMSYHWPPGFTTLPVRLSDAVVVGEVSGAEAHVTVDKSTVYSEFKVEVVRVLKNDDRAPLAPGGSITAERLGGRARYPSGHVSRFRLSPLGMPRAGGRYVLFLTRNAEDESYHLFTGYELRDGRVFPLDKMTSARESFDDYINMDEAAFFEKLDAALSAPSPPGSQ